MSWRTIDVALELKYGQYVHGAHVAARATRDLGGGFEDMQRRADRLDEIGGKLNRNVTLPLVAAGAASVKIAGDFNTTFTRMATLAGVPVKELGRLKESVKQLAVETGRSPTELAEALYQIESSGVDASKALEVLELSAKTAALGMGEANTIADALTSVINAYGAENISAAQAADILTAAVREGKGEASAMAPQLGNLLPLAKQLKVNFADTAGTLAFLTQTSGDAARSSTMLEGVLQKLIKPTRQGKEELEAVGLSAAKVRDVIAKDGLAAGIDLVGKAFEGNSESLARFFDDQQGLVGVFQLLDEGGARWKDTLDQVANSQGVVNDGMTLLQQTDEFKAKQAFAELKVVAVEVGTALIPILTDVAGGIAAVARWFTQLPEPVQKGVLVLAGFAAALGPTVSLASNGVKAFSAFQKVLGSEALTNFRLGLMGVTQAGSGASNMAGGLISRFGGLATAGPIAGAGLTVAAVAMYDAQHRAEAARDQVADLRDELVDTGETLREVFSRKVKLTIEGEVGGLDGAGDEGAQRLLRAQLEDAGVSAQELTAILTGTDDEYQAFLDTVSQSGTVFGPSITLLNRMRDSYEEVGGSIYSANQLLQMTDDQLAGIATELAKNNPESFTIIGGDDINALYALRDAVEANGGKAIPELEAAIKLAEEGTVRATQRQAEFAGELGNTGGAIDDVSGSTGDYVSELDRLVDALKAKTDASEEAFSADLRAISTSDALQAASDNVAEVERRNAEAREQASQRVADARANEARQAEQSAKDIATAERNLAKAEESASEDRAEAAERLEDAKRGAAGESDEIKAAEKALAQTLETSADKHQRVIDLTEELTEARKTAEEQLESLQRREASDELDVEEAQIALIRAQQDQRETDPDETSLDRREEAVRVARAEAALEEAVRQQAANAEELAERQAAGVDGAENVLDATTALTEGREAETEALANQEAAEATLAAKQDEARKELIAASENVARVERETAEQVAAAQATASEAREQAAVRAAAASAAVRDAERESASVREQGNRDLEQAKRDVITATLDDIEAQGAALEAAGNTQGSIDGMITKYGELRATLQDGSPYAVALDRRIQALWIMAQLQAAIAGTALPNIPGIGSISGGGGGFAIPGLGAVGRSAGTKGGARGLDKGAATTVGSLTVQAQQLTIETAGASLADALTKAGKRKPDLLGGSTKPSLDRPALEAVAAALVAAGGAQGPQVSAFAPIAQFKPSGDYIQRPFGGGGSDPEVTAILRDLRDRPAVLMTGDSVAIGVEDPERAARNVATITGQRMASVVRP